MKLRSRAAIGLAAIALCSAVLMPAAANAQPKAPTPQDMTDIQTAPMNLVGFDPEIAAANGYEIRTLPNGREYSVPIGTPSSFVPDPTDTAPGSAEPGQVTTFATVWGDCGSSYVMVNNTEMTTGYNIKYDVLYGKWGVYVHSEGGIDQDFNLDHGATNGYWYPTRAVSASHYGNGFARVNNGSYVMTTAGGMCWSGNPQENVRFS
ncbi:hypothetical protein ACI3KX_13010 [Microbacterium sp. ZW CA_36]|uniref:hypothetical protein n=1 Tax=Microbacterium sp. ZW CA_36 TaxID=3378078 RepID=UPI0038549ABC